MDHIYNNR